MRVSASGGKRLSSLIFGRRVGELCVFSPWLLLAIFTLVSCGVSQKPSPLIVKDAWVRATVPGQSTTGGYLELRSEEPARLVQVTSPIAKTVEIHATRMENGIMQMELMKTLDLPAGETVSLTPGHRHLMLLQIKHPLSEGDKVRLTFLIERNDKTTSTIELDARVASGSGSDS